MMRQFMFCEGHCNYSSCNFTRTIFAKQNIDVDNQQVAAGYSHGRIRVWHTGSKELCVMFNGHDKAVTALAFNGDGSKLVSGSADTCVIVWDTVALEGLFKLRGHSDQVTCVRFIDSVDSTGAGGGAGAQLMSASKDGLMKLWDLETQSCVHTIVGHRSAVWAFDVHPSGDRLWTGSQDNMLRCVERLSEDQRQQEVDEQSGKQTVVPGTLVQAVDSEGASAAGHVDVVAPKLAGEPWRVLGHVQRQTNERVASVSFSADGEFLGCQVRLLA
jgi:WD40 repeat protein